MAQIDWRDLCNVVEAGDGLPVREVGSWSEDKLIFWHRYVQITTHAMVGKPAWSEGLVYVDLFGGPGVCSIKDSGKRIPGSPLIAAHSAKPFGSIIICEKDPKLAAACRARLKKSPAKQTATVLEGDSNELVKEVVNRIPRGALTLAFIDPEGLDARMETVEKLSARGAVDLLILFADAYDILRNVADYQKNPVSKLDLTLGLDSGWRAEWASLSNQEGPNARVLFAKIYQRQLRKIGYQHFGTHAIEGPNGPLYKLVYASKSEKGLEFWEKAKQLDKDGQRGLFS